MSTRRLRRLPERIAAARLVRASWHLPLRHHSSWPHRLHPRRRSRGPLRSYPPPVVRRCRRGGGRDRRVGAAASVVHESTSPIDRTGPPNEDTGPGHVQPNAPVAPEPRQIRLGDEFSRVGQALLDTPNAFTRPTTGGPSVLGRITDSIYLPTGRPAGFEPTRDALAELPQAARSGLEPVTSTTQKAFARLMRDVGGVQVSTRPKS